MINKAPSLHSGLQRPFGMPSAMNFVTEPRLAKTIHVLHLEDDPADGELVQEMLASNGIVCQITLVKSSAEYQSTLAAREFDIILADQLIPGYDGLAAMRFAREHYPHTPFVFVSGTIGEDFAIDSLMEGATDYVLKRKLSRLVPAVKRALLESQNQRERQKAIKALQESELKLRDIVHNVPGVVYQLRIQMDGSKYFSFISPNSREMFGIDSDSLWTDWQMDAEMQCIDPSDRVAFRDSFQRAVTERTPWNFEGRIMMPAGNVKWFQGIASPSQIEQELVFNGMLLDVNERKLAEQSLSNQMENLRALNVINQAIIGGLDLKLTLDLFLKQALSQLHVDAADVLLFNPSMNKLELGAGRGFRPGTLKHMAHRTGETYASQIARERQIIQIANLKAVTQPSADAVLLVGEKFVSYVGVPLIAKGEVCGILEIYHRTLLMPGADWLAFLNLLGNQAAISIHNATLFNDLQRSNVELQLAYDTTLEGWAAALDMRDKETEGHTERVALMMVKLVQLAGLNEEEILNARRGALLHDIGKMGIPDSILLKPSSLTKEEMEVMRQHPVYAYQVLSRIQYLRPALDIPYCHHEKWDGTGYPRGLKGEQIPLLARLFAVLDVWDALTSDRPYRPAWTKKDAMALIVKDTGTHFDAKCVEVFIRLILQDEADQKPGG